MSRDFFINVQLLLSKLTKTQNTLHNPPAGGPNKTQFSKHEMRGTLLVIIADLRALNALCYTPVSLLFLPVDSALKFKRATKLGSEVVC